MIRARGICKRYGQTVAVSGIDVEVEPGEIVGMVGENGAGKTTTLRMLAGFIEPDRGVVRIAGIDMTGDRRAAQRHLGYVPEGAPLYADMRVDEYLHFRARVRRVPRSAVRRSIDTAMGRTRIGERSRWLIGRLSRGWRQRVALADALLADPDVLLLDEPSAGLDPVQVAQLQSVLRELAAERAIVLASHVLPTLAEVATRMIVIARGAIVCEGSADELRARSSLGPGASWGDVFAALVADTESEPC